jgi:GNAT superfamily N-acetyltransferase
LENDPQGRHYGYYVEGELVSVISVFVEGGIAQFRKFATLEAYRGKGLGSKLFAYMLKELETLLVQVIWCNARLDAMAFYKRFGFEATGSPFEKGGVLYKKMSKSMTNSL